MSWQNEEDDRIEAEISDAEWCHECDTPIGIGRCDGCIAVSVTTEYIEEDGEP